MFSISDLSSVKDGGFVTEEEMLLKILWWFCEINHVPVSAKIKETNFKQIFENNILIMSHLGSSASLYPLLSTWTASRSMLKPSQTLKNTMSETYRAWKRANHYKKKSTQKERPLWSSLVPHVWLTDGGEVYSLVAPGLKWGGLRFMGLLTLGGRLHTLSMGCEKVGSHYWQKTLFMNRTLGYLLFAISWPLAIKNVHPRTLLLREKNIHSDCHACLCEYMLIFLRNFTICLEILTEYSKWTPKRPLHNWQSCKSAHFLTKLRRWMSDKDRILNLNKVILYSTSI